MKIARVLAVSSLLLASGCGPALTPSGQLFSTEVPQFGVNFIRYGVESPAEMRQRFSDLHIQAFRQLTSADVNWKEIEPQKGTWDFGPTDDALKNAPSEPIMTLFALQYASSSPPWATAKTPFEKTLGADARTYVETVVKRYANQVHYWEIGNEMDHWRAADPGAARPAGGDKLPPNAPKDGFSPEEQGVFFKQVAEVVRANDPDAVIVMPGIAGISDYTLDTWLPGVIKGAGTDTFDVMNYHFYTSWTGLASARERLAEKLTELGLSGKPVWLTETGSTSSKTLTARTNYPNSDESQAADIFRRAITAYAHGDELVLWHTYIGSPSTPGNDWRDYGILTSDNKVKPSYAAFKLFGEEVIPFSKVTIMAEENGVNLYKIERNDGTVRYVGWGSGNITPPSGVSQYTSVVPGSNGSYAWSAVPQTMRLTENPVIIR